MSAISDIVSNAQASQQAKAEEAKNTSKKSNVSGRTVGNPQLSDKAAKYYEQLKKKYSNMEFVLVSKDQKAYAQSQAASFANPSRMVVLIDDEKIERMAEDENYRKQYEGIIANSASGLSQMSKSLSRTNANVKGYGMQVNSNGTASFFAVIDKSLAAQRKRIAQKAEDKKEAKKAEDKKARKKEQEELLEASRTKDKEKSGDVKGNEDLVTVTASSIDELIKKINDIMFESMSDYVMTDEERQVGQSFDFSI